MIHIFEENALHVINTLKQMVLKPYNLTNWEIKFTFNPIEESDTTATCERFSDYSRAYINFDLDKFADGHQFIDSVIHELYHIVLFDFDRLMSFVLAPVMKDDSEENQIRLMYIKESWVQSVEPVVQRLTREFMKRNSRKIQNLIEVTETHLSDRVFITGHSKSGKMHRSKTSIPDGLIFDTKQIPIEDFNQVGIHDTHSGVVDF